MKYHINILPLASGADQLIFIYLIFLEPQFLSVRSCQRALSSSFGLRFTLSSFLQSIKHTSLVLFEYIFLHLYFQVRTLTNMCSVPLDLFSMLELGGQQPSSAMISMNQLTTGHHLANRRAARKKTTGIPNPKRMFEEVIALFFIFTNI